MAASLPKEGGWVRGTALEAVTPLAKSLGRLNVFGVKQQLVLTQADFQTFPSYNELSVFFVVMCKYALP